MRIFIDLRILALPLPPLPLPPPLSVTKRIAPMLSKSLQCKSGKVPSITWSAQWPFNVPLYTSEHFFLLCTKQYLHSHGSIELINRATHSIPMPPPTHNVYLMCNSNPPRHLNHSPLLTVALIVTIIIITTSYTQTGKYQSLRWSFSKF